MTIADQVLAYLKVLVWPTIVVFALVLFRDPIKRLLGGLEEFEGFGIKAKIRSRVTQAAADSAKALAASPIERRREHPPRIVFIIGPFMQRAWQFSPSLVPETGPAVTDPLQRMRMAFERLDTAIIAVLVATAVPEQDQEHSTLSRAGGRSLVMSPTGVEVYMLNLTGYSGWKGVIETRDILRRTLASICGKNSKALTPTEANYFDSVVFEASSHLARLVNSVANLARG
jgi:hypothetical protein